MAAGASYTGAAPRSFETERGCPMSWLGFVLLILIPLAEIVVMIEVGRRIGTAVTIGLILLTGVAGAVLARAEGFAVMHRVRQDLEAGRVPARGLLDGSLVLVGALLLLAPGFITDTLGFILVFGPTRSLIRSHLTRWLISLLGGQGLWLWRWKRR